MTHSVNVHIHNAMDKLYGIDADKLYQPHSYYSSLNESDDIMVLFLVLIDQVRSQCEQTIQRLSSDKSIFKTEFKRIAKQLYSKPVPGQPLPLCNNIEVSITKNLSQDELVAYSVMASHFDDVLQPHIDKLYNVILLEVGKAGTKNQRVVADLVKLQQFSYIACTILRDTSADQHGREYCLCKCPTDPDSRNSAFRVNHKPILDILNQIARLIFEATKGESFTSPVNELVDAGIRSIYSEACDIANVLKASEESGIKMERQEWDDVKQFLARREERERKTREAETAYKPEKRPRKTEKKTMADLFTEKGWNVKL